MCGIAGIIDGPGRDWASEVLAMTRGLCHRGPDAEGCYSDPVRGVFLGHRRLSIIDLTAEANQPMFSADQRLAVVYNGEIYNFVELRKELENRGCVFHTRSDTEVILHGYASWGESCFTRFRGMFAIGLYDFERDQLLLVRDPLGIKPLYYTEHKGGCAFASEARVLWSHAPGGNVLRLNHDKVQDLLAWSYLPDSEETIVEGIKKVPPATIMTWRAGMFSKQRYWNLSVDKTWENESLEDACSRFGSLFDDTIRMMLRSDVPLGFLLSGGLDSSLVVAAASKLRGAQLKTFTAIFGHELDEGPFARKVADYCGTDHTEFRIEVGDAVESLIQILPHFDDLGTLDGGLFSTALISREIVKRGIKVAFVGEGADEIFGGYSWFGLSQLPFRFLPMQIRALGYYYANARLFRPKYWKHTRRIVENFLASGESDIFRQVTAQEIYGQLPNHLLQKVDRATMSASLEARVPFMDHKVVEAVYSLPMKLKRIGSAFNFFGVQEKLILRKLAETCLPSDIAWRKKRGFLLPIADMILLNKEFVRDALMASDSAARDYFSVREMEKMLQFRKVMYQPLEKEKEVLVWRLLLFSLWHRHCLAVRE
ncbi:MAG: asparagine synthase (glutamine-hydrolyzing) [Lentisphaerae bacterium]|nr:asparagine synthase (glutamine-hydrolyzing) [Lentisphaerota bacterium]